MTRCLRLTEILVANSRRLGCLTLLVVLAACRVNDGGRPAAPRDVPEPELREHFDVVATVDDEPFVYHGNVFVLPVAESLARVRLPVRKYTAKFYEHFDDAFDFLMFVANVESPYQGIFGTYHPVRNDTAGIGQRIFSDRESFRNAAIGTWLPSFRA